MSGSALAAKCSQSGPSLVAGMLRMSHPIAMQHTGSLHVERSMILTLQVFGLKTSQVLRVRLDSFCIEEASTALQSASLFAGCCRRLRNVHV